MAKDEVVDNIDYEQAVINWALKYNGYDRIGHAAELGALLTPLKQESLLKNAIPAWIGVDLLRAWAFYAVRSHRWDSYQASIFHSYPELEMVLDAIRNHRGAKARDLPPARAA